MPDPLTKSLLEPNRYDYLSLEDSSLYDSVKDSDDPKDQQIKKLIEDKAAQSRQQHRSSRY